MSSEEIRQIATVLWLTTAVGGAVICLYYVYDHWRTLNYARKHGIKNGRIDIVCSHIRMMLLLLGICLGNIFAACSATWGEMDTLNRSLRTITFLGVEIWVLLVILNYAWEQIQSRD